MTKRALVTLVATVLAQDAAHAMVYGGDEADTGLAADIATMISDISHGMIADKELSEQIFTTFRRARNYAENKMRMQLANSIAARRERDDLAQAKERAGSGPHVTPPGFTRVQ